ALFHVGDALGAGGDGGGESSREEQGNGHGIAQAEHQGPPWMRNIAEDFASSGRRQSRAESRRRDRCPRASRHGPRQASRELGRPARQGAQSGELMSMPRPMHWTHGASTPIVASRET